MTNTLKKYLEHEDGIPEDTIISSRMHDIDDIPDNVSEFSVNGHHHMRKLTFDKALEREMTDFED